MSILGIAVTIIGLGVAAFGFLWTLLGLLLWLRDPEMLDGRTMRPKWQRQLLEGGALLVAGWIAYSHESETLIAASPALQLFVVLTSSAGVLACCAWLFRPARGSH